MRSERRSEGRSFQTSGSSRLELGLTLAHPRVVDAGGGLNGSRATVATVGFSTCDMSMGFYFDFNVDSLDRWLGER